jgi:hypothetical protein
VPFSLYLSQVLDGELAQRAAKTRKLREVQKQLMLLGGLVPPSPLVTQLSLPSTPGGAQNDTLHDKQRGLKDDIEKHSEAIKVRSTNETIYCTSLAAAQECYKV